MATKLKLDDVKLTPEMIARMKEMQVEADKARNTIAVLKDMGMDTKKMEEQLDWATSMQDRLLKEFS